MEKTERDAYWLVKRDDGTLWEFVSVIEALRRLTCGRGAGREARQELWDIDRTNDSYLPHYLCYTFKRLVEEKKTIGFFHEGSVFDSLSVCRRTEIASCAGL